MTVETARYLAASVLVVAQLYMINPSIFARFWDRIARICGYLANVLGWIAIRARLNYLAITQENA